MQKTKSKDRVCDRVVIISDDDTICKILDVQKDEDGCLHCGELIVPIADAGMVKISDQGRVFFYNCSIPYINEIYHLAEVEKNIVINKALVFSREQEEKKGPGFFMYFIVALLILAVILK